MASFIKLICKYCKKQFSIKTKYYKYRLKIGSTICFCSHSCSARFNNRLRVEQSVTTKGKEKTSVCIGCNKIITVSIHCSTSVKCKSCRSKHRYSKKHNTVIKNCIICNTEFLALRGLYCKDCKHNKLSQSGRNSILSQGIKRRSKNEIYFAQLCKTHFETILENAPIFDGWDADVIIEDLKIAVLWNGIWHYKKVRAKHSIKQVQSRDEIKLHKIQRAGYTPYIIEDYGKHNLKFVNDEFNKFISSFCLIPPRTTIY